jgi:TolB-like protein/Tfp pilus assembly protein PilF
LKAITSLAILPLVNTCDDPGMDYFSDGVTESIINLLAQLPRLRVVARSSAFRYKGVEADPQEAGRALNVEAVLAGRVRQVKDRLIIGIELIDVTADAQLWGEHYNKRLSDIFEVQEEIAREITEKLRLRLSRKDKGRITKRHTANVEAYQAYLKGRYFWNKRTAESLNRGIEYFKQAIDLDPSYASAYAGLSDSYTLLVVREALAPEEGFAKAKAAAARALEIDEEFAEAHASMGHAMLHNWEWDVAERELKRAIGLNSGYSSAHHWYSEHLTAMGRCDESIIELRLAERLDPLSLIISADLGRALYYARDYDQVIKQEARTLEMDSNFWLSHINMGRSYTQLGMHAEAISELERAREVSLSNTEVLSFLGFAHAAAGKRDEALKTLLELDERAKHSYVPPYHFAIVHAGLGQKDQAFEWLERAFEKHAVDLFTLKVEPMFDGLRSDPRFEDLLVRMGLASPETTADHKHEIETDQSFIQAKLKTMAVLPFKPISAEGRDEYLELGMADALITRLSHLKHVVVRPTSAVRKYTELETDPVIAGRELRVESVIEGNIQRVTDRIRVTTRLVRVQDGSALWTATFDERFTDIFAVQDSISEKVATALSLKLSSEERERLTKRYTDNTEAYHLYLKGRYYWNKRSEESLDKALECFRKAIDIDPNYALAYAGLADCYTKLGDVGVTAIIPREAFARARAAASRALEIDSTLAEIHASLGHLHMHLLQWADAENDFKRAIELNPNYATAYHWYAYYMAFHCRFDEALEKIEVALRLDPLSLSIIDSVGEFLYFSRRSDESIEHFHKALELDPNFLVSRINLGRAYEQLAMFSEAEAQFVHARKITAESIDALAALGHTYAVSGNTVAALEVLAQLMELSKERYVSPYDIALIHTALGKTDEAFRWLGKAYDECVEWMIYTNADPRLDPLRTDSRFSDLLKRLGFAPGERHR